MLAKSYPFTLALLRIFAAFIFWQHGAQKVFGMFGGDAAATFTLVWVAGLAEFFGSILLAVGFLTRPVSLVLAVDMAILYLGTYLPQGFPPVVDRNGEAAAILFAIAALFVFTGPERFSVDSVLKGRSGGVEQSSIADHLNRHHSMALGAFRILIGLLYLEHGMQKMFGMFGANAQEFGVLLWYAGVIEFLGGVAITLGLFTRAVTFVTSGQMAFAFFLNHFPRAFFPIENAGERAVLFSFTFLFLVSAGAGLWSLDGLLKRRTGPIKETK